MAETLRDVMKKLKPSAIDEEAAGGVQGCPHFYKQLDGYWYRLCHEFSGNCEACWGQLAREDKRIKRGKRNG